MSTCTPAMSSGAGVISSGSLDRTPSLRSVSRRVENGAAGVADVPACGGTPPGGGGGGGPDAACVVARGVPNPGRPGGGGGGAVVCGVVVCGVVPKPGSPGGGGGGGAVDCCAVVAVGSGGGG
ncbi:hypothetical protein ACFV4N_30000, partial [Actinosynnema sp. NPDC059797]